MKKRAIPALLGLAAVAARAAVLVSDPTDTAEEPAAFLNAPSVPATSAVARALAEISPAPNSGQQIRDARESVARRPRDAGALAQLGRALLAANRLDEAAEYFWRAARLRPRDAGRLEQLGFALLACGDHRNGLRIYEEVAKVDGRNPSVRLNLAAARQHVGQSREARALLQELTAEFPESLRAWYNLGVVQWTLGELDDATASLQRALKLQHGHPFVLAMLARVEQARGRADFYEETRELLRRRLGDSAAEALLAQDPPPIYLAR